MKREPRRPAGVDREERVLYSLMVLIGAIPVTLTLASGTRFGVQATLGLLMALWGLVGLVRGSRARRT
jgi:hypothetical protein